MMFYVRHFCFVDDSDQIYTFRGQQYTTITRCATKDDQRYLHQFLVDAGLIPYGLLAISEGIIDDQHPWIQIYPMYEPGVDPKTRTHDQILIELGVPSSAIYWLKGSRNFDELSESERFMCLQNAWNHLLNAYLAGVHAPSMRG